MAKKKGEDVKPLDNPTLVTVDPGGVTGWSVTSVHPEALCVPEVRILSNVLHWSHGQITGSENEQTAQLLGIIDSWPGCYVLIEDFILRTAISSREVLSPVRITAKLEYALWVVGKTSSRQMPSEAKSVATDSRLKSWGFYQREGGLEHARDADRHALTWLRKCKEKEWLRKACWPYIYGPGGEFGASVPEVG